MPDIVAMRRVSAYRTTDDKLHDTRPRAIRHQAELDLAAWLLNHIADAEAARDLALAIIDAGRGEGSVADMIHRGLTPDAKRGAF